MKRIKNIELLKITDQHFQHAITCFSNFRGEYSSIELLKTRKRQTKTQTFVSLGYQAGIKVYIYSSKEINKDITFKIDAVLVSLCSISTGSKIVYFDTKNVFQNDNQITFSISRETVCSR